MSAPMKKHPTKVAVVIGNKKFNVPKSKISPLLKTVESYKDDSVDSDDLFQSIYDDLSKKPGVILKGHRLKNEMTQQELAEELGTQKSNISAMENGKRDIGKELAKKLAKIFKTNYRVFL